MSEFPVVVVGAGPVGLAAAAHLVQRQVPVVVFEQGAAAGAAVREWTHVRMFSPWREVVDPAGVALLERSAKWRMPSAESYPTGEQWASEYLIPLAEALGNDVVRTGARVVGVARRGRDRVVDAGRDSEPLSVYVRFADGSEQRVTARAVIDA